MWQLVHDFWFGMGPLEQWAVVLGLIYIFFSVLGKPICWPFGIVSCGLWGWVSFSGMLYSDAILQLVYVVLGFYGWWQWLRGGQSNTELPYSFCSARLWALMLALCAVGTLGWGFFMSRFTNAVYPWWDALTTIMSFLATWMLAKRIIENWLWWVVADTMYIFIYHWKGWNGFSALMVVYTLMAATALWVWWRAWRRQQALAEGASGALRGEAGPEAAGA